MGKTPTVVNALLAGLYEAEQTTLADQVAEAKSQIADLKERLLIAPDAAAFESISLEIAACTKKLLLLEARERLSNWEGEEEELEERRAAYQARVERIGAIRAELAGLDVTIFDGLKNYVEAYLAASTLWQEAHNLAASCELEAAELFEPVPEIPAGPVIGLPVGDKDVLIQVASLAGRFASRYFAGPDRLRVVNVDGSVMKN